MKKITHTLKLGTIEKHFFEDGTYDMQCCLCGKLMYESEGKQDYPLLIQDIYMGHKKVCEGKKLKEQESDPFMYIQSYEKQNAV